MSRSTAPSRLIDALNLLQPFEVSNCHFLSFRPLKIGTFSSFTIKRPLYTESEYNEESGPRP